MVGRTCSPSRGRPSRRFIGYANSSRRGSVARLRLGGAPAPPPRRLLSGPASGLLLVAHGSIEVSSIRRSPRAWSTRRAFARRDRRPQDLASVIWRGNRRRRSSRCGAAIARPAHFWCIFRRIADREDRLARRCTPSRRARQLGDPIRASRSRTGSSGCTGLLKNTQRRVASLDGSSRNPVREDLDGFDLGTGRC